MIQVRQMAKAVFAVLDRFHKPRPGPRVLIYHQVGTGLGAQMGVTVDDFEWQLQWLAKNRSVVSLDEAIDRWDDPESSDLVALSFDDGFSDTFTTAFPRLVDHAFPFALFVASGIIGQPDWEGRGRPLDWDQIGQLHSSGLVTLGAHTHSHVDLRRSSVAHAAREIALSDQEMLKQVGVRPRHFAYPWGYWSADVDPLVRDRYESAFVGSPHLRAGSGFDPHIVHRVPIQLSDGRRWFPARLHGGLLAEETVRRRLRGYSGP